MALGTDAESFDSRLNIPPHTAFVTVQPWMDAATHLLDNPPMDYPRLETATLGELNDNDYFYGGDCQSCHRSQRISLERLRVQLGDAFPLAKVRTRLKCSACGSRKIIVSFWTPVHAGLMEVRARFKEPFA